MNLKEIKDPLALKNLAESHIFKQLYDIVVDVHWLFFEKKTPYKGVEIP